MSCASTPTAPHTASRDALCAFCWLPVAHRCEPCSPAPVQIISRSDMLFTIAVLSMLSSVAAQAVAPADLCCYFVDNVLVFEAVGSVMGEPCTGEGACLLIEKDDTFSCEIDPDRFTGAKHCAKDIGIWCGGGRKCGQM